MKENIIKLTKTKFVRNVMIVASGTVAAQIITMLASPFITRLYGPEAFGVLGVFMAVIAMITPISALTYPTAIVLPKSDNLAKVIIRLSLLISILLTIISFIVIILFDKQIIQLFNIKEISSFLLFIPLVILFSGILQVCEQWLIRKKYYRVTAKVTLYQAIIFQGSKIGIGLFYPFASVLIIITVISQLGKALMLIIGIRHSKSEHKASIQEEVSVIKIAKDYKDFPLYRAPEVFLNSVSQSLPVVVLTALFGPASAGFYTIGRTVLNIPSQLIGKAIGDVLYPRLSEAANNKENVSNLLKKATLVMTGVGIVPFSVVILFGPFLFSLIFGNEWLVAGEYARWIALWSFCAFINRPSVMALPVISAQAFHLRFTIYMLIVRITSLYVGYSLFGTDVMTVALFSIAGAILNILLILFTIKRSINFDKKN